MSTTCDATSYALPAIDDTIKTAYVNLAIVPRSRFSSAMGERFMAIVLLENPIGENLLSYDGLVREVG